MSRRIVLCVVASLAILATACGEKSGAGDATPTPATAAPSTAAPPTAAPPTAAPATSAPDTVSAPKIAAAEIVELGSIAAEIDCTVAQHDNLDDQEAAINAILAKAKLSRDAYDDKVLLLLEDETFTATRERTAAVCRAALANKAAQPGAGDAMRDKIKGLAVAAECMRKQGLTSDKMASAMMALYQAHGISLETYSREMARFGGDQAFQDEVTAATADCPNEPTPGDDLPDVTVGAADADEGADTAAAAVDPIADAGPTPDTTAVAHAADTAAEPAVGADTAAEPVVGADTATEPAVGVDTATAGAPDGPTEPVRPVSINGVYRGRLSGSRSGTMRMTVQGTRASATIQVGGINFRVTGTVNKGTSVVMRASSGVNSIRLMGTFNRRTRSVSGSWNGVLKRKQTKGNFTAKR